MADLSPSGITRKARTKGGLVTILTVLSLVTAIGATWFGLSVNDHVAANYDASAWLWSNVQGELARVNGLTGKTDTRQAVPNSKGHPVELSQSDRYLIMRDLATGKVSSFDPATLSITSTMDTQQGVGITIALHNDSAFIVDAAQGVVRQLDPATLQPIGETLRFPPGITGGSFDGRGRLWVAVPSEGTVTSISPAPLTNNDGQGGRGGAATPTLTRTEAVATPWHDLSVSALDNGVAVFDQTNGKLVAVRDDKVSTVVTDAAGGDLPNRTGGDIVPVTVIEGRDVYVISGDPNNPTVNSFTVPGNGRLQPAVAWAGRLYIADDTNGEVFALDQQGRLVSTIKFKVPGPLQLEVREDHLFINSPGSNTAHVINDKHEDKEVDKFRNEILGGDPPNVPAPPVQEPVITKPSAPKNIKAAAGDNQATLTWGKAPDNGSRITKYVVTGNGQTWEVGANQRSLVITGLINGTEYVFGVSAFNSKGQGPEGKSNKVVPTRDVPDPPTEVTATALPNGTVEVSWTAANGQGRKITRYEVTAVSGGAAAPVGVSQGDATKLVIPDKELDYGKQYAFSVITVNDIGAGSKGLHATEPLRGPVQQAERGQEPWRPHGRRGQGHGAVRLGRGRCQRQAHHGVRGDGGRQDADRHDPQREHRRVRRRRERHRHGGRAQRGGQGTGGHGDGQDHLPAHRHGRAHGLGRLQQHGHPLRLRGRRRHRHVHGRHQRRGPQRAVQFGRRRLHRGRSVAGQRVHVSRDRRQRRGHGQLRQRHVRHPGAQRQGQLRQHQPVRSAHVLQRRHRHLHQLSPAVR
jgi:hypothetical protein